MTTTSLAFIDEVQGANFQSLANTNFQVAVVDADGDGLTPSQVAILEGSGKTLLSYLSIGESENYRSYWQSSWTSNPPSFLVAPDPAFPGDYMVRYWDPVWQQIVLNEAVGMAKAGYDGVMLDVVAAYQFSQVAAADGGLTKAIADMVSFVEKISAATKAVNPDFKIVPNAGLEMLSVDPSNPGSASNASYLATIDGLLTESIFYMPDNTQSSDSSGSVQAIQHAQAAGKSVLDIEYPTSTTAQQAFINAALAQGYVPFASDLALDTTINPLNSQIPGKIAANAMASVIGPSHSFSVQDSAADITASLDGLQGLAAAGKLGGVTLTNGGAPVITITAAQFSSDAAVPQAISSPYALSIAAPAASVNLSGLTGHSSGLVALQFSDTTLLVASTTPVAGGGVSSAEMAALYAGVLGRVPDITGLAFYEQQAAAKPSVQIVTYAEWFLASPEYTGNPAHTYAQTTSGDASFITDVYASLLHRAPEAGAVAWYQAHVMAPILGNAAPGTTAYSSAEFLAHATFLTYVSQSPEFLGDVQVTAQNAASAQHWLLLV